MKKSVGIITFHAAHNYGSMLQTFALQEVVRSLGFQTEIINLRNEIQKKMYLPVYKNGKTSVERIARRIFVGLYKKRLLEKHKLFEGFIKNNMDLSAKEFSSLNELIENTPTYDYYISGSDQIWNTSCADFDWAYYLPFVKKGVRVAYAPSIGQRATETLNKIEKDKIKEYISLYDFISVREEDTAKIINEVSNQTPQLTLDPTLLLNRTQWESKISSTPIIDNNYIFYYAPRNNPEALSIARKLSRRLNIKLVTSIIHSSKFVVSTPDIKKELAVGPLEFLNLCKNAKLLCGDAYHLMIFAIILNIPFFAPGGMKKNRIKHLFQLTNFTNRSISKDDFNEKVKNTFNIDFTEVNNLLKEKKDESLQFLSNALK